MKCIRRCLCLLVALVVAPTACEKRAASSPLTLVPIDSDDIWLLSGSPADWRAVADSVPVAVSVGGANTPFTHVVDAGSVGSGEFVLLTIPENYLLVYDSLGNLLRTIGRRGDAPGEFKRPWSLASTRELVAVWDAVANKAITVLRLRNGSEVTTYPQPGEADLHVIPFRNPSHTFYGRQQGLEPIHRRMSFLNDSILGFYQQEDERWMAEDKRMTLSGKLLTLQVRRGEVDTVARFAAPKAFLTEKEAPVPGAYPETYQEVFGGRPLWTAGDGWVAFAHGDSTSVRIQWSGGQRERRIQLAARRKLTDDDRNAFVTAWERDLVKQHESAAKFVAEASRRAISEQRQELIAATPFAVSSPSLSAIYGDGRCLYLSGFEPADHWAGEGRTFAVVDVNGMTLLGFLRAPNDRVVDISDGWITSLSRDEEFIQYAHRARSPFPSCHQGTK